MAYRFEFDPVNKILLLRWEDLGAERQKKEQEISLLS
jgi:hypothetical protein